MLLCGLYWEERAGRGILNTAAPPPEKTSEEEQASPFKAGSAWCLSSSLAEGVSAT